MATASWVFGTVFVVFIFIAYFGTDSLSPPKQKLLGLIGALLAGLFGFFMTGSIGLIAEGQLADFGKIAIEAAGGLALFVLVLLWWNSKL